MSAAALIRLVRGATGEEGFPIRGKGHRGDAPERPSAKMHHHESPVPLVGAFRCEAPEGQAKRSRYNALRPRMRKIAAETVFWLFSRKTKRQQEQRREQYIAAENATIFLPNIILRTIFLVLVVRHPRRSNPQPLYERRKT